jgi:hypothetical protein
LQGWDREAGNGSSIDSNSFVARPGSCIAPNYGLPTTTITRVVTSYPASGSLSNLPPLALNASMSELKRFVARVYDIYPTFKLIYEKNLGLSRAQALAFMYADMSRESASNLESLGGAVGWNIVLETAIEPADNSAHAWGPFQAAVTNFIGGGYDSDIKNATQLPTPHISQFKNPAISTFAGMKRLAEGILISMKTFGPNQTAATYLLGSLADHNTGWASAATTPEWLDSYGNEVLRLMQGYLYGSNMTNDRVFWTGEPTSSICR